MDFAINIGSHTIGIVDMVIFLIVMISAVVNCIRGFVSEFSHVGGLIAGFFTGIMFTWTGDNQSGRAPFVSSSKKAVNLSSDPKIAL